MFFEPEVLSAERRLSSEQFSPLGCQQLVAYLLVTVVDILQFGYVTFERIRQEIDLRCIDIDVTVKMGATYGVMCPTLHLDSISFPWTGSVTTSGQQESRDAGNASVQGCQDEESLGQTPETDMAALETSRDRSFAEDCGKATDNDTWRVRSCEESLITYPDMPRRDDVVTSQPEPEVVTTWGVGRQRFRDAALTIASQFYEPSLDGGQPLPVGSVLSECTESQSDDVTGSVLTSTNIASTSSAAADCASRGRGTLLAEMLRARAKQQKVSNRLVVART